MKGKIAFVMGGVLGYVLGSRAGRKRYEQIKGGALKLWNSGPVQNGVGAAQGYAQERAGALFATVLDAGKSYLAKSTAPVREPDPGPGGAAPAAKKPAAAEKPAAKPVAGSDSGGEA